VSNAHMAVMRVTDYCVMCSFIKGHSILIGFVGMAFFLTLFMTMYLRRENARRDALARERGQSTSFADRTSEEMELADNASWFRYTV
jgi:hypothetical protein